MTLARKVFLMMEIGKRYTASDLERMVRTEYKKTYNELLEANDMDTYLAEEWIADAERGDLRKKIREALATTRKFGYTKIEIEEYDPWYTPYVCKNGKRVRFWHKGGKNYYYTRIRA